MTCFNPRLLALKFRCSRMYLNFHIIFSKSFQYRVSYKFLSKRLTSNCYPLFLYLKLDLSASLLFFLPYSALFGAISKRHPRGIGIDVVLYVTIFYLGMLLRSLLLLLFCYLYSIRIYRFYIYHSPSQGEMAL